MLDTLFGSKNIKKILLFLFLNGKCYGTQVHRLLKTPLTPIQKALNRLEKGGVVLSRYEGKTRFYQFNPAYPLIDELEQLLKKAYALMSPSEKKHYSFVKFESGYQENRPRQREQTLLEVWNKLAQVKKLAFHAKTKSKEEGGWNGKGKGEVTVTHENDHTLIFNEKGTWRGDQHQEIDFSNVFRWTLDRTTLMISLEHLRRGWNHPVFLFDLVPAENESLISADSHLCEGDVYFGQIFCDPHCLRFNWRVIGPRKNEEIEYFYS